MVCPGFLEKEKRKINIINLIIYDMKNLIGLEINENYMLNVISSQPRR